MLVYGFNKNERGRLNKHDNDSKLTTVVLAPFKKEQRKTISVVNG